MIGRMYVEYHLTLLHTNIQALGLVVLEDFQMFSHYKPMADNDAPGAWPIRTQGSQFAGIIKGLTKHCFTQNKKALDVMVSEKKIFLRFFPFISLWRPMSPRGVANLDPRGIIGRIYEGYRETLLHTKYIGFRPCGFREDFSYFPIISLC